MSHEVFWDKSIHIRIIHHFGHVTVNSLNNEIIAGTLPAYLLCYITACSLKPYNIKGKTVTTNVVDGTGVPLSVMIRQTISGLEGQCCLSGSCSTVVGSCSTAWEVVALLGKL